MKTLLLLRHAKSSWDEPDVPDHDRPLNDRGKLDAPRIGEWLKNAGLEPDVILSSTAKRARKTAEKVCRSAGWSTEVELRKELYLASPEGYLKALAELGSRGDCVLIVGHNPGLEQLVAGLTGHERSLPTATVAQLQIPARDWSDLRLSRDIPLVAFCRPADLD